MNVVNSLLKVINPALLSEGPVKAPPAEAVDVSAAEGVEISDALGAWDVRTHEGSMFDVLSADGKSGRLARLIKAVWGDKAPASVEAALGEFSKEGQTVEMNPQQRAQAITTVLDTVIAESGYGTGKDIVYMMITRVAGQVVTDGDDKITATRGSAAIREGLKILLETNTLDSAMLDTVLQELSKANADDFNDTINVIYTAVREAHPETPKVYFPVLGMPMELLAKSDKFVVVRREFEGAIANTYAIDFRTARRYFRSAKSHLKEALAAYYASGGDMNAPAVQSFERALRRMNRKILKDPDVKVRFGNRFYNDAESHRLAVINSLNHHLMNLKEVGGDEKIAASTFNDAAKAAGESLRYEDFIAFDKEAKLPVLQAIAKKMEVATKAVVSGHVETKFGKVGDATYYTAEAELKATPWNFSGDGSFGFRLLVKSGVSETKFSHEAHEVTPLVGPDLPSDVFRVHRATADLAWNGLTLSAGILEDPSESFLGVGGAFGASHTFKPATHEITLLGNVTGGLALQQGGDAKAPWEALSAADGSEETRANWETYDPAMGGLLGVNASFGGGVFGAKALYLFHTPFPEDGGDDPTTTHIFVGQLSTKPTDWMKAHAKFVYVAPPGGTVDVKKIEGKIDFTLNTDHKFGLAPFAVYKTVDASKTFTDDLDGDFDFTLHTESIDAGLIAYITPDFGAFSKSVPLTLTVKAFYNENHARENDLDGLENQRFRGEIGLKAKF